MATTDDPTFPPSAGAFATPAVGSVSSSTTAPPGNAETRETADDGWDLWKDVPPDGSPTSVQNLLALLSRDFQGHVYLGWRFQSGPLKVFQADTPSEQDATWLHSTTAEAAQTRSTCLYATRDAHTSSVLENFRTTTDAVLMLGFGVRIADPSIQDPATCVGVVICIDEVQHLKSAAFYSQRVEQLQRELPRWIATWYLCSVGRHAQSWSARWAAIRGRQGRLALGVFAAALLVLAIPVPYRPQRECTVEPAARAFISSPVEGHMATAEVRPGDIVSQGQLLANLDDDHIRWDLSAAKADYEAAGKRRDTALATRSGGDMRLAQLEQERIGLRISSLTKQLEQLEIRSPIHGIVVQGDWHQSDGAPVRYGDTLFEIAPLDEMRLETHLTTEDLSLIAPGTFATGRFDAAQGQKWSAKLQRIDPRGQVIGSKVVFVAEMQVANPDHVLRPGMHGTARLSAGTKSIGWLLFHRPYTWVMKKLVW